MREIEPRLNIEDEDTIFNYKGCIRKEGYSFIGEWFDRNTVPGCYSNEQKLKLCHLMSIAAHEFRRETGKIPNDPAKSCGLCLYHRKNMHTLDGCENCAIWGGRKVCCQEYITCYKDNSLSLIIKFRKTFVEKYYKEERTIKCDRCGENYDSSKQYPHCPHELFGKLFKKETTMKHKLFWMVKRDVGPSCKKVHNFEVDAHIEAERLAKQEKAKFYVLQSICYYEPVEVEVRKVEL